MQANTDAGKDAPVALKGVAIAGNVELERPQVKIDNVAAVLPGSGALAKQYLVIGAHYDHIGYGSVGSRNPNAEPTLHPGADDNASGTAGLLLLADYFAQRFKSVNGEAAPRRTIIFAAFAGEERGLLGSKHMVKHIDQLGIKAEDVAAMLNMDMIGRVQNDKLFAFGVDSGDRLKALLEQAAEGSGLELKTDGGAMGASDHASFYMASIPAVHFFTGTHKDYHAPSDTADKINAPDAARVLNVIAKLGETIATEQTRLAFQKSESNPHAGAAFTRSGAWLGIMPDYTTTDGDQGCGLDGVTPGSPAEAAGLKGGDLIVGWNGEKLNNIKHLMEFLGKSKPGEKVKMKVKRGDEMVELEVKLGKR
jgi:Zn-dependent M28 family amino/carboxypeptidase